MKKSEVVAMLKKSPDKVRVCSITFEYGDYYAVGNVSQVWALPTSLDDTGTLATATPKTKGAIQIWVINDNCDPDPLKEDLLAAIEWQIASDDDPEMYVYNDIHEEYEPVIGRFVLRRKKDRECMILLRNAQPDRFKRREGSYTGRPFSNRTMRLIKLEKDSTFSISKRATYCR